MLTPHQPPLSRSQLIDALDLLAATTTQELDYAEALALHIAAIADAAAARLSELAGLRTQIQAATAIAEDARPSPLRRHRPSNRVVQVA